MKGTENIRTFVKSMISFKSLFEFVIYNSVFFMLSVYIGNSIDNVLNRIFGHAEQRGIANKESNLWLCIQIAVQLMIVGIAAYAIRLFIIGMMAAYGGVNGIMKDAKTVSLIYGVVIFIGQDNLRMRFSKLNQIMDRP